MLHQYPWFDTTIESLKQAYDNNRLPHAVLLAAPEESGKRDFTRALANSLLCRAHEPLTAPCGHCKACQLFSSATHPDFYYIDRLTDNKGKQKKSIGVDQIRLLTKKLSEKPQAGGWRIALVSSVSAMTTASFNALLKTLEEPGEQTLLILLSENIQNVPATIRSRCQIIKPAFSADLSVKWLLKNSQTTEEQAFDALQKCYFAPLAARDYLNNNGAEERKRHFSHFDEVLKNQQTPQDALNNISLESNQLSNLMADYFYEVAVNKAGLSGESDQQVGSEERASAVDRNKKNSTADILTKIPQRLIYQLYDKLVDYNRAQSEGSNLQAKLQFEAILIQWFEIGRKISHYSRG